jgi:ketosteroid isomerase-like protein
MSVPNPPVDPSAQQLPPPMPPAGSPVAEPKKNNVLALVALIVAAVGFIFACIPGALIVGWILLPIAFVLSIVSLFMKGDRKWMGIVGLILSVVGTIVGFIVFFAVMVTAAGEALDEISSGETVVTQPADEDAETAAEDAPADGGAEGTRDNPYPLASQISSDDWTVVVNSYTADGNPVVTAGNEYNEAAPAGSHYEVVNYTVTYTGDDKGLAAEVGVAVVTSGGNVVNSYDSFVLLADPIGMDELYNGASATGSAAFVVPDGETVLIRVRPGMLADEVFVQP